MADRLRLMCVVAHPDDECMGTGPVLARYAAEGVETYVVTATRGERGWQGDASDNPGLTALGERREAELRAACEVLGVHQLHFLDYLDGDVDQANPTEAVGRIVAYLRQVRPQVVITFGPEGSYGHPDHIAISQFTTAACVAAADPEYDPSDLRPHRVDKLYYMVDTQEVIDLFVTHLGDIQMTIDGVTRSAVPYPDWLPTTVVDTLPYWRQVWQSIRCHQSQLPNAEQLARVPEAAHQVWWGRQNLYRVYSLVNGGRQVEADIFDGLR